VRQLKVVAIAGSLRQESYNRKILQVAKKFASELGASVEEVDLKQLALPIYDGDIEAQGLPVSVQQLKATIEKVDVLLIATPEYNYSITGALKNAIDWLSRGKNSLDGKAAAIFGASTSILGTVRSQTHLRVILEALNVIVVPQPQIFIRSAAQAFAPDWTLKDEMASQLLKDLIRNTLELAGKLKE